MNTDLEESGSFESQAESFRDSPHTHVQDDFPEQAKNSLHLLRNVLATAPLPNRDCPHLWVQSSAKEEWFPLEDSPITVGGKDTNGLQVSDEYVSSCHCRLERRDDGWLLIDLNSTNGLYVNGERVSERTLKDGDFIQVGRCSLIFVTPEPHDLDEDRN